VRAQARNFAPSCLHAVTWPHLRLGVIGAAQSLQRGLDHILIFTGNGDFRSLVSTLQELGKRVSVVSTLDNDHR